MAQHGRERVQEEGGEFVERVKDEGVVPEGDRGAQRAHRHREVGVEPPQVVGEVQRLGK